jgi:hypothetical protein
MSPSGIGHIFRLLAVLGLRVPAVGLIAFGKRGASPVPTDRTVVVYWEKWTDLAGRAVRDLVSHYSETEGRRAAVSVDYVTTTRIDLKTLIATSGGAPPDLAGGAAWFANAFNLFLPRQFCIHGPEELSHGARIDGLSQGEISSRIVLPLSRPAWDAVAVFQLNPCLERLPGSLGLLAPPGALHPGPGAPVLHAAARGQAVEAADGCHHHDRSPVAHFLRCGATLFLGRTCVSRPHCLTMKRVSWRLHEARDSPAQMQPARRSACMQGAWQTAVA